MEIYPDFETQDWSHQKSKNRCIGGPQKVLMIRLLISFLCSSFKLISRNFFTMLHKYLSAGIWQLCEWQLWTGFFLCGGKLYFGEATSVPLLSYYSANGSNVFLQLSLLNVTNFCFWWNETDGNFTSIMCIVCEYGDVDFCSKGFCPGRAGMNDKAHFCGI